FVSSTYVAEIRGADSVTGGCSEPAAGSQTEGVPSACRARPLGRWRAADGRVRSGSRLTARGRPGAARGSALYEICPRLHACVSVQKGQATHPEDESNTCPQTAKTPLKSSSDSISAQPRSRPSWAKDRKSTR